MRTSAPLAGHTAGDVDWSVEYVVSRALVLEVAPGGQVAASTSISRPPVVLPWNAVPLLGLFGSPRTVRDAYRDVADTGCTADEFGRAVSTLAAGHLIVNSGAAMFSPSTGIFSTARDHHNMLKDVPRLLAYRTAIERHVAGKTVVDLGAGTGILSMLAAHAGAVRVDAIEESRVAGIAADMLRANGCGDTVVLHRANSRDVTLATPADVLVHELIGIDPFDENILPTIADARRRLLRPGGRLIPFRIEVCCYGFEVTDQPYSNKDEILEEAGILDGLWGLDFEPYRSALRALPESAYEQPIQVGDIRTFRPRLLSAEQRLFDLDLTTAGERWGQPALTRMAVSHDGVLGGLLIYFRAHLDQDIIVTNSPFAPNTTWRRGVRSLPRTRVRAGDTVDLRVDIATLQGRQRLAVHLVDR